MVKVKFKELSEAFTYYFDLSSNVHSYNARHAKSESHHIPKLPHSISTFQNQKVTTFQFQDLTKSSLKRQLQVLARNYGINYHKK